MDRIALRGGKPLFGEIPVSGAKNAALPLMAAAILTDESLTLVNAPALADVATMGALLGGLGVEVWRDRVVGQLSLRASAIESCVAPYDVVRKMRASILVLGPLLAREHKAQVSLPGGCAIGARPVDLHLKGLEALGAQLDLREGYVFAEAPGGLKGAKIVSPVVSVGATENLLMAAVLAKGESVLENAAREPEIVDLAHCLRAMGAIIEGEGSSTIRIQGVERLRGATHRVLPDRIEMGSYMLAPAIAGGSVEILGGRRDLVAALIEKMEAAGVTIEDSPRGLRVSRRPGDSLRAVDVTTAPFPGFPTDLQAQMMALLTIAEGESRVDETIFENRFMHAPELARMGARIEVHGGSAVVRGVERLKGAPVMATDLRASIGLILAGLAAEGETVVSRVYHLDRGYERLEAKLSACGAEIRRLRDQPTPAARAAVA